jgi:O-antigen/teichoic acid export membrane protein
VSPRLRLPGRFRAPVARILLGSVIGQGAVFAVSPLLTRMYSPADFGALALVTAVCAVLGGFVTLSWERAVTLPSDEATARAVLRLGWISLVVIGTVLAVIAYAARSPLSDLLGSRVFEDYWWLVPVTLFAMGAYALVSSSVVRAQDYSGLAVRNGVQGLAQAASSVLLGIAGLIPLGLLTSLAVGRAAGLFGLGVGVRRAPLSERGRAAPLRDTLSRYRRFPLVNTWSRAVNSLGLQLPTILLIALYGSIEAGLFALTIRVIASPINIVVDAVSQYFEGSFTSRLRGGEGGLTSHVLRFARRQLLVGIVPTVLIAASGALLYEVIFGEQWSRAGMYAQIIVVAYLAQYVVAPVSRALVILERQTMQFVWDVTRAVLTAAAVVACAAAGLDMVWCIVALTGAHLATYAALFVLIVRAARARDLGRPASAPEVV